VGRYRDFTRSFLPRDASIKERWKRIYAAAQGMEGLPPIEVYRVGEVYFVKDGNHRVSVAREMGAEFIQAYVREFTSPVPISADTRPDELILKAEEARFLKHTRLDQLRPDAQIRVTSPGYYDQLEEHIAVHGYFLGLQEQRDISWQEAVTHWHDHVYMPLTETIREHHILQEFPGRTETDLYLWIIEHRHFLAQRLGLEIDMQEAAKDFATQYSPRWQRVVERAQRSLADVATPDSLESGPPVGGWRRERAKADEPDQLFGDLLVLVDDSEASWCAVDQGLWVARLEQASLYGLWVGSPDDDPGQQSHVERAFLDRCQAANVRCKFTAHDGETSAVLLERAPWVDLILLGRASDARDSEAVGWAKLLQTTLRQAAAPVLSAVEPCRSLGSALLAYDDSPTSCEALFIAAHIGQHWGVPVHVITVREPRRTSEDTLGKAIAHLQNHGVRSEGLFREGPVAETILATATELEVDLVILGASGFSPFVQLFAPSTVGPVVSQAPCPVLVCH
jgi:nucleotide-binding universal stress UspA family protein